MKTKCDELTDIKNKIYDNRFKLQRKLRKRKYSKNSLKVFRNVLTIKEYIILRFFYKKMLKFKKIPLSNSTKTFIREFLKFDCYNVFFRDYYLGVKSIKKYTKIGDKSFYSYDKRMVLDTVILDIVSTKNEDI